MKDPYLEVSGLRKSFDGYDVLRGVSMVVRKGDVRAIIGPNGAGKSTLFRLLIGELVADQGSILLDGRDVARLAVHHRQQLGMAAALQIPSLVQDASVRENLFLAAAREKSVFNLTRLRSSLGAIAAKDVEEVLDEIRLRASPSSVVRALSHGDRKRLEIGCAIAQKPSLLLLDEPLAGIEESDVRHIANLLSRLSAKITIILIEHRLEFLRELNVAINVLHKGEVIFEGTFDECKRDAIVREVYFENNANHS